MTTVLNPPGTTISPLHLTRVRLNQRSPRVQRALGDAQRLHQLVMSFFPKVPEREARAAMSVLFRVDDDREPAGRSTGRRDAGLLLMIQSTVAPRSELAEAAWGGSQVDDLLDDPFGADDPISTRDVAPVFDGLADGQRLGFRLRANPTKRLSLSQTRPRDPNYTTTDPLLERHRRDGKGTGPRVALLTPDEQVDWLVRQGERHGFALVPQARTWSPGTSENGPEPPAYVLTTASVEAGGARRRGSDSSRLVHNAVTFDGELVVTDADQFRRAIRGGIGPARAYGFGLLSLRRSVRPSSGP